MGALGWALAASALASPVTAAWARVTHLAAPVEGAQEEEDLLAVDPELREIEARLRRGEATSDEALLLVERLQQRAEGLEPTAAREVLSRLLELTPGIGDHELHVGVTVQLAQLLLDASELDQAKTLLTKAFESWPRARAQGTLAACLISVIHRYQGGLDEALAWCDRAETRMNLKRLQPAYRDLLTGEIAGRRFEAHIALGTPDTALEHLRIERKLARAGARAFPVLHEIDQRLATQREAMAIPICDKWLPQAEDAGFIDLARAIRVRRAVALAVVARDKSERREEALSELARARGYAGESATDLLELALREADLLLHTGDRDAARRALERARRANARLSAGTKESRSALLGGEDSAYLAGLKGDLDPDVTDVELESALEGFLKQAARTPARPGGNGFLRFHGRRVLLGVLMDRALSAAEAAEAAGDASTAQQRRLHAFDVLYRAQTMGTQTRLLGTEPPDSTTALERVLAGPSDGLLMFFPIREKTFVLGVRSANDIRVHLGPGTDALIRLRRDLVGAERTASRDPAGGAEALERIGRRAGTSLLGELATWCAGLDSLAVTGLDLLGELPIEHLRAGETALGEAVALRVLPSLPYAALTAPDGPPDDDDFALELGLFVASEPEALDEEGFEELRPIPFDDSDAMRLSEAFDGDDDQIVSPSATPESLREDGLLESRVLVVIAHGREDDERVRSAGILLDGEEAPVLTCEDIEALERVPPLVVLATCGAGLGAQRPGEDALPHLGGALLQRGARCVLLSSRPLRYDGVINLLEPFLASVRAGASPAEALRRARAAAPHAALVAPLRALGHGQMPVFARPEDAGVPR